ncbi:MerR family transcriptional regulator [Rhodococcus sp. NPDC003318]|uniref:MerR family transcriptional regulator n=1 Tax=Rhodococcus sp. NPDC003318 TaxID=3364503 RepID=UPI00367D140B
MAERPTESAPTERSRRGVYGISVASELSGVGQQALRLYESKGLLTPARTEGGTRRYSEDDIVRLRQITELLAEGVNLAAVDRILTLESRNTDLQSGAGLLESANAQLTSDNARLRSDNDRLRTDNAQLASDNNQLRQERDSAHDEHRPDRR